MGSALDMNQLQKNKLINVVYDYLNGVDTSIVRATLTVLCNETEGDARSLYQSILVYPENENALFKMLRVPQNKQKNYRDAMNLFELLTHLHQDGYGHGHLGFLLRLINDTKYHHHLGLKRAVASSIIIMSTAAFFYIYPQYFQQTRRFIATILPRILLDWIKKTFSILRNITFIGMGYSIITFLLFLYQTFYHGFSNLNQKLTAVFFKSSATSLSLAGYILCFLAAGVATPLTGVLFISAAGVDVIESLVSYFMIRLKPLFKPNPNDSTWNELADRARQINQREQALKSMWVKLGGALLVTGLVAVWCFFPPSLILTLTCMASITVVGLIKAAMLSSIESGYTEKLQKKLQSVAESYISNETPPPSLVIEKQKLAETHLPQQQKHIEKNNVGVVSTAKTAGTLFNQNQTKSKAPTHQQEDLLNNTTSPISGMLI